jgi:preprotein translocase subunit SecF
MKLEKINFASKFPVAGALSVVLVILSLILFAWKGLNYGVDFRGGAEVQVKFAKEVTLSQLRKRLENNGFDGASVQTIGPTSENEFLIKVKVSDLNLNEVTQKLTTLLTEQYREQSPEIRKTDIVGPKAGKELRNSGFQAMFWALLAIMIYVGLRFDFKYSPGAIVALFHDVTIIIGIFSLTGKEFTLQIVAALLAVIGYSVNDTVVVYDRVREHEEKYSGIGLVDHINNALNETLSRTILTSCTTLFVSLAMLFFGGTVIHDFFFSISLGVAIGTYSSIFVAAPATLVMDKYFGEKEEQGKVKA